MSYQMQRVLNDISWQEKEKTTSGLMMSRRGSTLQHLTRDSQNQILTIRGHDAESVLVCDIFVENIGVSLWLNCNNSISFVIILLNLCHLVLAVVLYAWGEQHSGEQWTAMSLLLFSAVAVLLLQLVKRSICSEDLNLAVQQLDAWRNDWGTSLNVRSCYASACLLDGQEGIQHTGGMSLLLFICI